jgi:hypothetical protein
MRLIDRIRLKYGMRWKRAFPTPQDYKREFIAVTVIVVIAALCVLWVSLMTSMQSERVAVANESSRTKQLADCLNGTARFEHDNGKGGHGKTVVLCRKAELLDV